MADVAHQILLLSRLLRAGGHEVSLAETIDATNAANSVGLHSRELLRSALRACLFKVDDDSTFFDETFDRCFPLTADRMSLAIDPRSEVDVAHMIASDEDLAPLAAGLVSAHGGLGDATHRSQRHHLQRVLRSADLARLMSIAMHYRAEMTPADIRARIDELKRLISTELTIQLAEDEKLPEDSMNIEFLNASRSQLDAMRRAVRPLARKIASRMIRRRQNERSGRINLRRTMRRSLGYGGVPLETAHQRKKRNQPELWLLCDVSGSVAEFSLFTLTLVAALAAELPRTRSFIFVDAVDEITDLLHRHGDAIEPWQLMRNTNVIGETGHSDYRAVFTQFLDHLRSQEPSHRATVVVVGDGRNNHRPAGAELLAEISRRTKAVYWFNPEPASTWSEDDSEMRAYAVHCRRVFEVRDLDQLARSVELIS